MKIQNDIILKDFTGREYVLMSGKTMVKILNSHEDEESINIDDYDYVWVDLSKKNIIEKLSIKRRFPIAINITPSAQVSGVFGTVEEKWSYSLEDQSTMKKIKIENIPTDIMQFEADCLEKSMMYKGYCIITLFKDELWTELSKKTPEIKKWVDNTEILKNIKGAYLLCLQKGKSDFPRHSDTQNESFGTFCGKLIRLHIPLITDKSIKTTCWNLESESISHHMSVGNAYYFDTRKPHVISNESGTNRVHLALDIEVNQTVKDLLMDSPEISKSQ